MHPIKSILILSLCLFFFLSSAFAGTKVAPQNRINIWIGSSAISDTSYTHGTTSAMGTVKTLKSNASVLSSLSALNTSNMYFSSKSFNGSAHQSISESGGLSGQCVAFAKSMTGAGGTPNWSRSWSIASYVNILTRKLIPAPNLVLQGGIPLQSGTMIAYFNGLSTYPQDGNGHVAIFLNWTYDPFIPGKITGMNVVDQNLIWTISGTTGSAGGLIQKHWLPWSCTAGSQCSTSSSYNNPRYYASNYHVVSAP